MFAAFIWPVWARNRWRTVAGILGLLTLWVLAWTIDYPGVGPFISTVFLIVSSYLSVQVTAIWAFPTQSAAPTAIRSAFPKTVFTLPIKTSHLLWIPVLVSTFTITLLWGIFATTALIPLHIAFPVVYPYLAVVSAIWWLNGFWWVGSALSWRTILAYLSLILIWITALQMANKFAEVSVLPIFAFVGAAAMGIATKTSDQARQRGSTTALNNPGQEKKPKPIPTNLAPLRTPFEAQVWAERGTNGANVWAGPAILGALFLLCTLGAAIFDPGPHTVSVLGHSFDVGGAANICVHLQPQIILFPAAMVTILSLATTAQWSLFLSVRPISSARIAAVKLRIAAESAAWITAVFALCVVFFLLQPAQGSGARQGTIGGLLLPTLGAKAPYACLTVLATFYAILAGVQLISATWSRLQTTRMSWWVFATVGAILIPLVGMVVNALTFGPTENFGPLGWAFFIDLAALKTLYALIGLIRLGRSRLVATGTIAAGVGLWLSTAAGFAWAYRALLLPEHVSTAAICLGVVIAMPINRLIWLPLNIDAQRHSQETDPVRLQTVRSA